MMKRKNNLQRREFMYETKLGIAAVKWQDNKPVLSVLSTAHNTRNVKFVKRKNRDGSSSMVSYPAAVAQYNEIMALTVLINVKLRYWQEVPQMIASSFFISW